MITPADLTGARASLHAQWVTWGMDGVSITETIVQTINGLDGDTPTDDAIRRLVAINTAQTNLLISTVQMTNLLMQYVLTLPVAPPPLTSPS